MIPHEQRVPARLLCRHGHCRHRPGIGELPEVRDIDREAHLGMVRHPIAPSNQARAAATALTCGDRMVMVVMLTRNCPGIDRRSPVSAGWSAYESSSAAEPPVRVTVDEEVFDVTTQPDHPGAYHYAWIFGPNPDYGFPRRHRTDGRPPWSTTRRRSGTSCRWWTLRPDTSNRTHSSDAE